MSDDLNYADEVANVGDNGRDKKVWIIVAVVLVVLCCCCIIAGGGAWWLWNNGDEIFGLAAQIAPTLL